MELDDQKILILLAFLKNASTYKNLEENRKAKDDIWMDVLEGAITILEENNWDIEESENYLVEIDAGIALIDIKNDLGLG